MGIIVVAWIALWTYVELNEPRLIGKITSIIQEKTHGEATIGGASVSLISTFPVLSLQLSDVVVRDSLFSIHHKDFLRAKNIYLGIGLRALLRGKTEFSRISISNGSLNLITDSLERSNDYILRSGKKVGSRPTSSVPVIMLNNMLFSFENPVRRKWYQLDVRKFKAVFTTINQLTTIRIGTSIHVKNLVFNTLKGSYIKEKDLEGRFKLLYNEDTKNLKLDNITLDIDRHSFLFNGNFNLDKTASDFNLVISTQNIGFEKARKLLTDTLQVKLSRYAFTSPISPKVSIKGKSAFGNRPGVRIELAIDLQSVKSVAGITSVRFDKGQSTIDIAVASSQEAKDTVHGDLDGTIRFRNAEITYLPRNFKLKNGEGIVRFNNSAVLIDSLIATTGETKLVMNGQAKNLITLSKVDPGKAVIYWKLFSPEIHIKDFKAFIASEKSSSRQSSVDKMFASGDVYIILATPKMNYNYFTATQVEAQLVLKESAIVLEKASFKHANGMMTLSGGMQNGIKINPVRLHATMKNIDVPLLFTAFNNFGQDAITRSNLKGKLSADIIYNTALTNQANLIGSQTNGTVNFLLENGELNNFEPLQEVAKKAFKKQDFSQIKFADLKNKLDISGTSFIVNPMEIRSSAATIFVEGVYDFKKGTDMSIQFPLRNLTKSQADTDLSEEGKGRKGISLRLRAKTGDDGKLKVSWDPFKRAIRNKQDLRMRRR